MAEEEVEEQEERQGAASPAQRQRSLLRYLPLLLVVLLLQGVGAYFLVDIYVRRAVDPGFRAVEDETGRPHTIPEGNEPQASVDLGDFTTNARGTHARLLVRAKVTLAVAPKAVKAEIQNDKNRDRVRDVVLAALSNATPKELRSAAGRAKIKRNIKTQLNQFLYDGQVLDVYFSEFILQAISGYGSEP